MTEYRYNPNEFTKYVSLSEDMCAYYSAIDSYKSEKTVIQKIETHSLLETLHFTIKHRELDSGLDKTLAENMRDYLWGLLDD